MTSESKRTGGASTIEHDDESRAEVQDFLEGLAEALTTGDGKGVAARWAVPALVLGDHDTILLTTLEQVEHFFGGAREHYNAKGIVDTRPEILDLRWTSPRMALAEVRWPYLDADGRRKGEETSTYTLRRHESGALRIQGVVMHGVRLDG